MFHEVGGNPTDVLVWERKVSHIVETPARNLEVGLSKAMFFNLV